MKFILLVALLFLAACNPSGAPQESAAVIVGEEKDFTGVWTSASGDYRLVIRESGRATLYGVCDFQFSAYRIEFDQFAQGYVRLMGVDEQPVGESEDCARQIFGSGVNIQMNAELLAHNCMAIDYGVPRNRFCRDDSLQEWRE